MLEYRTYCTLTLHDRLYVLMHECNQVKYKLIKRAMTLPREPKPKIKVLPDYSFNQIVPIFIDSSVNSVTGSIAKHRSQLSTETWFG